MKAVAFAVLAALAAVCACASPFADSDLAEPYDIGVDMEGASFWDSDPVLFVKRHEAGGFRFTSGARESADTRQDGGVSFHGVPVFETKVWFGDSGGVARVELLLFSEAGTEAVRTVRIGNAEIRRLERRGAELSRGGFNALLETVRGRLTAKGAKLPPEVSERIDRGRTPGMVQKSQTWSKLPAGGAARLVWNYVQDGGRMETFRPGFVRLAVDGPERRAASAAAPSARSAGKLADNVTRGARGDVYVDGVPMVDQGQKGYCAATVAERVLRYYGVDADEHEIAQLAGTSVAGGTPVDGVRAVARRYRLAMVSVCGGVDKSDAERIKDLEREVAAYNRSARKLRKPEIPENAYVTRVGGVVSYNPAAVDALADPEVLRDARVGGALKSAYTRFRTEVRQQVNRGVPLVWVVELGIYPEPEIPQARGGHMRLIVGYNDAKDEILYSDSWGAGHELKRMPADWAWTISRELFYLKPLR